MPAYRYEALSQDGQLVSGVIDADSARQSRQKLKDKSLIVISTQEIKNQSGKKHQVKRSYRLKLKELSLIIRQLATLIAANLPLENALKGVIEQNEKSHVKEVLSAVRAKVLEGLSFSKALKTFPQVFSPLFCETIAAGEQTGRLDMILNRLADYSEEQQAMKSKIQQALIYPSLMILVSLSIIFFLLTHVIPKIINVFQSSNQALPKLTVFLIHVSDGIKQYGWVLIVICALLTFLARALLKKEHLRKRWDQFLLKVPGIGYFIKTTNTARFSHTLAILNEAGVPMLKAMTVATNLITNSSMKENIDKARAEVRDGRGLSASLKETKMFSPMALHLIASGENSGTLDEMLKRAAINQDKEIKLLINTGLTLMEPLIILLMGGFVLFIVLATLLPIFSMNQLVN